MSFMKKVFAITLVLLALCLVFISCSGDNQTDETQEIETTPIKELDEPVLSDTVTATPIVYGEAFCDTYTYAVYGLCENSSEITYSVDGQNEYSEVFEDGTFFIFTYVRKDSEEISLRAVANGKEESETVTLKIDRTLDTSAKNAVIGKNGHLHIEASLSDFTTRNKFKTGRLHEIKSYLEGYAQSVKTVSPDTELIIFISPNKATVYPETLPDDVVKRTNGISRLEQMEELFKDSESVTLLTPRDYLIEKKADGTILYNKTDTHWNELGAYYASEYLLNYMSSDFPETKIIPLDSYVIEKKNVAGGDLMNSFGIDLSIGQERPGVFVRGYKDSVFTFKKPYAMNFLNEGTQDEQSYSTGKEELPTVVMYRDSFSSNMMMYLADSLESIYFRPMWTYGPELDFIEQTKPDYVVIEIVERCMTDIFGG